METEKKIAYTHDQMVDILSEISLETVNMSMALKKKKAVPCEDTGRAIFRSLAKNLFGVKTEEEFNRLKEETKAATKQKYEVQVREADDLIGKMLEEIQKILRDAVKGGARIEVIPVESKKSDSAAPEGGFDA